MIINEAKKIDDKIKKDFIQNIVKPNLAKGVGNKADKIINSYAKKHNLDPDEVASLWFDAISELTMSTNKINESTDKLMILAKNAKPGMRYVAYAKNLGNERYTCEVIKVVKDGDDYNITYKDSTGRKLSATYDADDILGFLN